MLSESLFTPPFDKIRRDPGYIKSYLPGIRENDANIPMRPSGPSGHLPILIREITAETKFPTEEGKAGGLDQYQLRGFHAIQRHVALVAVVYSMLRAAQHDPVLRERLQ